MTDRYIYTASDFARGQRAGHGLETVTNYRVGSFASGRPR